MHFLKSFKKTVDIITHTLYNRSTIKEEVKNHERINQRRIIKKSRN